MDTFASLASLARSLVPFTGDRRTEHHLMVPELTSILPSWASPIRWLFQSEGTTSNHAYQAPRYSLINFQNYVTPTVNINGVTFVLLAVNCTLILVLFLRSVLTPPVIVAASLLLAVIYGREALFSHVDLQTIMVCLALGGILVYLFTKKFSSKAHPGPAPTSRGGTTCRPGSLTTSPPSSPRQLSWPSSQGRQMVDARQGRTCAEVGGQNAKLRSRRKSRARPNKLCSGSASAA